jgi:FkbM family methyltransferase
MISSLHQVNAHSPKGKVLRFLLNRIPKNHVARVRGGVNKGHRWVVGTSIHRCWLGSYEADKQALMERMVKPGMVVWDVGANAGFYTLAMSRLTGESGRVYSFEPLGSNIQNLNRHVQLNALKNTTVVQTALGDMNGLCSFDTGISHQRGFLTKEQTNYMVPVMTADEFLSTRQEAVPVLLKIDVEGAESGMLEGARKLLTEHHPILVLALHGPDQVKKCYQILNEFGYKIAERTEDPAALGEEILALPQMA